LWALELVEPHLAFVLSILLGCYNGFTEAVAAEGSSSSL